jgi:lipopolysaccharide export LptBFGC system permease protein LptF
VSESQWKFGYPFSLIVFFLAILPLIYLARKHVIWESINAFDIIDAMAQN